MNEKNTELLIALLQGDKDGDFTHELLGQIYLEVNQIKHNQEETLRLIREMKNGC